MGFAIRAAIAQLAARRSRNPGGKLSIQKTITYHLGTCREREKYIFYSKTQDPPFILTENFSSETWRVQQYPPKNSNKILGIQTAPIECVLKQINCLTEMITEWKENMKDPRLNSFDVLLSYSSQLSPKVKYSLVTCAATEKQLGNVHQGVMATYKHALRLLITA